MNERDIEKYLVDKVKRMGGKAYKFVSPGNNGVPDRIVVFPERVFFVELKAPAKKPSETQLAKISELRMLGQCVFVADSKVEVDRILENIVPERGG